MNANALKERLSNVKLGSQNNAGKAGGKPQDFAPLTGEFLAIVETIKTKTYSTGSFGYEIAYKLTDEDVKGRRVWENIIISKADGSPVGFSAEKLMKRLLAFGINNKALATFNLPETTDAASDLDTLQGSKVKLKLEREVRQNGQPGTKVKSVYAAKA